MAIKVFRRIEKKYFITKEEYEKIIELCKDYLLKDPYFKSNICNIYFDTEDNFLIKKSLDKPLYKEKVRLRSYSVPNLNSEVFLEIKKKFKGVVSKRRVVLSLDDFYNYYEKGIIPKNNQIMKEIDYTFKYYNLYPKVFIAYNRFSYLEKGNPDFRLTFDYNVRSRKEDLKLEYGDSGKLLLDKDKYIMEVKCLDSMPIWFSKILNDLKIYPISFSKYGEIYKKGGV